MLAQTVAVACTIDNRGGGWIGNARVRICTSATESATRTRPQHFLAAIANELALEMYLRLPALPSCRGSELRRSLIQPQLSGCQKLLFQSFVTNTIISNKGR